MMENTLQLAEMVQAFVPTTELGNSYQPISTCNHPHSAICPFIVKSITAYLTLGQAPK